MTAPVITNPGASGNVDKNDMTVPVLEQKSEQGWRYILVLPASYLIQTAPEPLNEDVKLSSQPQKRVAVIRYSGSSYDQYSVEPA